MFTDVFQTVDIACADFFDDVHFSFTYFEQEV